MTGISPLPSPPSQARIIDTGFVRFWMQEGIVFNETYRGGTVEVPELLLGLNAVAELTGGRLAPMVAWAPRSGDSSREARELFAGPKAVQVIAAMAMIQPTPVMRAVMNFFTRLYPLPFPIRFFATADEAIAWARTFVHASSEEQPRL
jgi:hypothetical protein